YAVGYLWAALRKGPWLSAIASVNVATALVVLLVLLALFTPIADPARLSVNDQMARLNAGKVGAAKFDFNYLRFEGARYGKAALEQLQARTQGPDAAELSKQATLALRRRSRWDMITSEVVDVAANLTVWPASARLPDGFATQ